MIFRNANIAIFFVFGINIKKLIEGFVQIATKI